MRKYNYDELMERALSGEKLEEREWEFLVWNGKEVDRVEYENRRWTKRVDAIIKWRDKFYAIRYDEALTESQEDDYFNSSIREVKPVNKMVEITEWQDIRCDN